MTTKINETRFIQVGRNRYLNVNHIRDLSIESSELDTILTIIFYDGYKLELSLDGYDEMLFRESFNKLL